MRVIEGEACTHTGYMLVTDRGCYEVTPAEVVTLRCCGVIESESKWSPRGDKLRILWSGWQTDRAEALMDELGWR